MLIDSNIVIYGSQEHHLALRQFISSIPRSVSIVSYIEAMGYHGISRDEEKSLIDFFNDCEVLPLSDEIARQAVALRRQRRIGLGDAIIAATAITHNLTLVTRNTEDFRWIAGLGLLDPLTSHP